jgi:hypothetical protein
MAGANKKFILYDSIPCGRRGFVHLASYLPVESSRNSLLHSSLPVVATVRSDIDCSLIGNHLCALLPGSFYENLV